MDSEDTPFVRPRIEVVDHPELDLGALEPTEVHAAWRYLDGIVDWINDRQGGECQTDEQHEMYDLWVGLIHTFDRLPGIDLDYARSLFRLFVDSPLTNERAFIVAHLHSLTKVDRDYGLTLWNQLVRDPQDEVRDEVDTWVRDTYEFEQERGDLESVEAALTTRLGLTISDALSLMDAHARGEYNPSLGQIALQRLTSSPSV